MFCALLAGIACDAAAPAEEAGDDRGSWQPTGKADENTSCVGHCGEQAPAGCWCDEQCHDFGDCCPDVMNACEIECPNLTPPAPSFCPDGHIEAQIDEQTGCTVGFDCITCPNLTPPSPDFCADGQIAADIDEETGCIVGFDCTTCPQLVPPAPGFCPGGEIVARVDEETGCLVGFDCVTCPILVPPGPGFCPGGDIDATIDDQTGCVVGFTCN